MVVSRRRSRIRGGPRSPLRRTRTSATGGVRGDGCGSGRRPGRSARSPAGAPPCARGARGRRGDRGVDPRRRGGTGRGGAPPVRPHRSRPGAARRPVRRGIFGLPITTPPQDRCCTHHLSPPCPPAKLTGSPPAGRDGPAHVVGAPFSGRECAATAGRLPGRSPSGVGEASTVVRVSVSGPQVPLKVLVTLTVAVALPFTGNSTRAEWARLTTWAVGDQAEYSTVSAPPLSVWWMTQYACW